ncbi:MAG: radical SAM protein [Bacilli bacterium]|nr:radical SAM protein [Bacilli bacterium]
MVIKEIAVNEYLTKSNLPSSDYVINPYVGCPHGCKYCYASFMKRFTGHKEDWGTFIDIKKSYQRINLSKISKKSVFLSSVTDCYNPLEEKYKVTRKILEQLLDSDCYLSISTKSKLILRDIDLLKRIQNVVVSMSINTLDEEFKKDMDNASTIQERLDALKELHNNGIRTVLFMSPIFPYITEWNAIIEKSKDYVDEYWFENLNLRGQYKTDIMNYIKEKYPQHYKEYVDIYEKKNKNYWHILANQINEYCKNNNIEFVNYFYHEELVKAKKENENVSI